jgi:hypothetical protein
MSAKSDQRRSQRIQAIISNDDLHTMIIEMMTVTVYSSAHVVGYYEFDFKENEIGLVKITVAVVVHRYGIIFV